ncbi:thiazole synthase [Candidatus Termititenax persephonae]|uniref:Thiazole synthase n=1 Tax=Candidatus Termititenax persephonae TaxID=2218525 RepID=A0A388TG42_9BACT|nr:thiazole synthase [Candidatus Termititenax persephonae]
MLQSLIMDELIIAGQKLTSRFFLGTGKFASKKLMQETIEQSGAQVVTVALRRVDLQQSEENILNFVPKNVQLMVNTSGARHADEAVRIARLGRASGAGNWIKIEVSNDSKYLLPDNQETVRATEILAAEGFVVLPYISPDLYTARALVKAGAAAVMPLGALIGSNQGLQTRHLLEILRQEITEVPLVVDAGIGAPSQAAAAMEMGYDAALVNTAVALADDPVKMARAFALAVEAGRAAYLSGQVLAVSSASASSPLTGFLYT